MMQERETLMVELTAIATNIEKACKVASRLPACYARFVEARKNAAPDVEALEERERERWRWSTSTPRSWMTPGRRS